MPLSSSPLSECEVWTRVGDLCVQPSGLCARTRARAGFVLSLTPEQENWHCLRHVLMPEPCTSVMCHVMCVCSECGPRINNERNASSQREAFRHYSFLGHTRFLLGGQLLPAPLRAAHCSPPLWTPTLPIPSFWQMPITATLREAIEASANHHDATSAAFDRMSLRTLEHLLGFRPSFPEGLITSGDLNALQADFVGADPGQGQSGLPDDATTVSLLRVVILRARVLAKREEAKEIAAAVGGGGGGGGGGGPPAAEDLFRPLPPATINDAWEAMEQVTSGYLTLPPQFRMADSTLSRMVRANRDGDVWLPTIASFSYKEAASTKQIATLLRSGGGAEVDVAVQAVIGTGAERRDDVGLIADFLDIIIHRSAAIMAAYSTPHAASEYSKATRFGALRKHASLSTATLISPGFVSLLEQSLRQATRRGISVGSILEVDRSVVEAINARAFRYKEDGNLAIEFVCCQQSSLFYGSPTVAISLSDISRSSDVGPSASRVGGGSDLSRMSARESQLQSERDKAKNELADAKKRHRPGDGRSGDGRTTYGGKSGRSGGGDPRGKDICNNFNGEKGCFAKDCKNRHVCNFADRQGRKCGRDDHSAPQH